MILDTHLGRAIVDGTHPDKLLARATTCTDISQLTEAREAARLFGAPADVVAALDSRISALTGIRPSEQPLRLSDIGEGIADYYLRDALKQLAHRLEECRKDEGDATLTIKIEIAARAGQFVVVAKQPSLKLPDLPGRSQVVRISRSTDGDVYVMDRAEGENGQLTIQFKT